MKLIQVGHYLWLSPDSVMAVEFNKKDNVTIIRIFNQAWPFRSEWNIARVIAALTKATD